MTQDNVELMRELWPAELDMVDLATNGPPSEMRELVAADVEVEFRSSVSGVPPLAHRGLDGLAEGWREWLLPFESYLAQPREFVPVGDDVLVTVAVTASTHRGGVVMEHSPAVVCAVRDRMAVRLTFYLDADEARRELGLAE